MGCDPLTLRLVRHWEGNTISARPRLELLSAFVIAPLVEEAIFRLACFRLASGRPMALASAVLFGLLHRRFGHWFVSYAFVGGLITSTILMPAKRTEKFSAEQLLLQPPPRGRPAAKKVI